MARKGGAPVTLIVFLALGAAAVAGGALLLMGEQSRAAHEAQAAARDVPSLPAGPLQVVNAASAETRLIATDSIRRSADGVQVTVLRIGRAADALEGKAAMISVREAVDCASRRLAEGRIGAFDADGKLLSATNGGTGSRGRPVESADGEFAAVCGAEAKGRRFTDREAAQRALQALPTGSDKRADADPKDAHLAAWLCAAAARGWWRAKSPADCDRAVRLNPASAAVLADRGFVALEAGRNGPAEADFQKALALDPDDEAARLGHAAILQLRGDKAGEHRIAAEVLARDPDALGWLQHAYRVSIDMPPSGR